MDTNKVVRLCGIACLVCGLIISAFVFSEAETSTFNKIIGPLQVVVGLLFILISSQRSRK